MAIIAAYPVDDEVGLTIRDVSGNGRDATLSDDTNFWGTSQVPESVIGMDSFNLSFTTSDGRATPKTLAEIMLECNSNDQYFHNGACAEDDVTFTFYRHVQTGDDLQEIKKENCL